MVLPERSRVSVSTGGEIDGLPALCDVYGRLIGHRYSNVPRADEARVRSFSNVSLPEACATIFDEGPSHFDLSANLAGLDLVILAFPSATAELAYEQRGTSVTATAGEAVLYSSTEALRSQSRGAGRLLAVALPRSKLGPLLRGGGPAVLCKLPAADPALRMFRSHAETWLGLDGDPDFSLSELMGDQLCDLAALAIGANGRGRDRMESGTALRDARFRRASRFIKRNLHRPGLAERHVAAHLGISPSLLRAIFAGYETSPAQFIRQTRLERAHQLLSEARHGHRTVLEIALDCGFGSMSSFYRLFRDAYGGAPGDLRP